MPTLTGRTKLAKLDFFVRYPEFLQRALAQLQGLEGEAGSHSAVSDGEIEAPMIRYRYGPWDPRYRNFVSFLETRKLLSVRKGRKVERYVLTRAGVDVADRLVSRPEFGPIVSRCAVMSGTLAKMSGTELKELIYELFPREVGDAAMRSRIAL
ncbi:hypothetical protein [Motilibacter deserti]|uniref:Uncharacterized protein n=1 Tax=Motilibacter deserti TaxID=2714956 RepID=A0ABX0GS79_9ACTN|nr:hypothetical protein [Motilibacter deserti]NHC12572.1 hypothetical protein [Motilibacter deserti]